jgi:WD40 repeat protein
MNGGVSALAVSEGIVISGSWDKTLRRWDLRTGRLLNIIYLGSPVNGLALAGNAIIAACNSGLVRIDISR